MSPVTPDHFHIGCGFHDISAFINCFIHGLLEFLFFKGKSESLLISSKASARSSNLIFSANFRPFIHPFDPFDFLNGGSVRFFVNPLRAGLPVQTQLNDQDALCSLRLYLPKRKDEPIGRLPIPILGASDTREARCEYKSKLDCLSVFLLRPPVRQDRVQAELGIHLVPRLIQKLFPRFPKCLLVKSQVSSVNRSKCG